VEGDTEAVEGPLADLPKLAVVLIGISTAPAVWVKRRRQATARLGAASPSGALHTS